jgi:hypothetical protein
VLCCAFYDCSWDYDVNDCWVEWIWRTHLSTAATIGDTVIAAVRAVAASMRSLAGIFRFFMSGIVAIRSTELTLMVVLSRG